MSEELADYHVPPHVYRLFHHYHNVIYIKNYWESLGQKAPQLVLDELVRLDKEAAEVIEREKQQGGYLHKRGEDDETRKRPEQPLRR
jgi:hypothetical protein